MAQDSSTPKSPKDPFSSLVTEIEGRPAAEVEEGPRTASSRYVYWLIGGVCALTVGLAEIGVLLRDDAVSNAPVPPPALMMEARGNICASRMAAVMEGILAYKAKTGAAPMQLAALYPAFISFQPIDPAVNEPYGYTVAGESITLTCPSAAMGGASAAAPGPGA